MAKKTLKKTATNQASIKDGVTFDDIISASVSNIPQANKTAIKAKPKKNNTKQ